MATVYFYKFKKRTNSTLRPDDATVISLECEFYEPTDILNPQILIKYSGIEKYNYCKIPALDNRYYFIQNWIYENGIWRADTTEDVLASWQQTIFASEQYVVRSTKAPNFYIHDSLYPFTLKDYETYSYPLTIAQSTKYLWKTPENWDATYQNLYINMANFGYWDETDGYKFDRTQQTYVFRNNSLSTLFRNLVGEEQLITLNNYIKRAYYLPIAPNVLTDSAEERTITGNVLYGAGAAVINLSDLPRYGTDYCTYPRYIGLTPGNNVLDIIPLLPNKKATVSWQVEKPNILNNTKIYQNSNEYVKAYIKFQPFGIIEIDPNEFINQISTKYLKCEIDFQTGDAILYKSWGTQNVFEPIASANVSIPIQLSSVTTDNLGYMRNAIAGLTTLAIAGGSISSALNSLAAIPSAKISALESGAFDKKFLTSIAEREKRDKAALTTDAMHGSAAVTSMLIPPKASVQISGMPGSILFDEKPEIIVHKYNIVDTNVEKFGAMTMTTKTLNSIAGGFVQCQNSQITSETILGAEKNAIESYLNGGIYLE